MPDNNWYDDVHDVPPPPRAPMGIYGPVGIFKHEEHEHGHEQGAWSRFFERVIALAVASVMALILAAANVFEPSGHKQFIGTIFVVTGFLAFLAIWFADRHWVRWLHAGLFGLLAYVVFWFAFHHGLAH